MMQPGRRLQIRANNMTSRYLLVTNVLLTILGVCVMGFGLYMLRFLENLLIPDLYYKKVTPLGIIKKSVKTLVATGCCMSAIGVVGIIAAGCKTVVLLTICCVALGINTVFEVATLYILYNMEKMVAAAVGVVGLLSTSARFSPVPGRSAKMMEKLIATGKGIMKSKPKVDEGMTAFGKMLNSLSGTSNPVAISILQIADGPVTYLVTPAMVKIIISLVIEPSMIYFTYKLINDLRLRRVFFAREGGAAIAMQNVNNANADMNDTVPPATLAPSPVAVPMQPMAPVMRPRTPSMQPAYISPPSHPLAAAQPPPYYALPPPPPPPPLYAVPPPY